MRNLKVLPPNLLPPRHGGPSHLPLGQLSGGQDTITYRNLPQITGAPLGDFTGISGPGFGVLKAAGSA